MPAVLLLLRLLLLCMVTIVGSTAHSREIGRADQNTPTVSIEWLRQTAHALSRLEQWSDIVGRLDVLLVLVVCSSWLALALTPS